MAATFERKFMAEDSALPSQSVAPFRAETPGPYQRRFPRPMCETPGGLKISGIQLDPAVVQTRVRKAQA